MSGICLCQFSECPESNNCKRYLDLKTADSTSSYAEFKNICKKENDYMWLWKIGNNIEKSEENKNE